MYNITVGRFDQDPSAQGVVRPEDGSWQLVVDKNGFPHLYVRCQLEDDGTGKAGAGMLCIEDLFEDDLTIPDIMKSTFGGKLSEDEERTAFQAYSARKERTGIPCPR